jgi:hypothetical protein
VFALLSRFALGPLAGREIWLPPAPDERPRAEFLEWHADEVFRG